MLILKQLAWLAPGSELMLAGKQADELSPATMATLQCLHRAAKSLLGYVPTTGTHLLKNRRCCHGVLRCFLD